MLEETFITPHGEYRELRAYQTAEAIYDLTFHFCERYLRKGDRTIDQMVQAARSGKQNIAEASRASGTSKETEVKLMNVARASLEEVLLDYEDYIRVRGLPKWDKNSVEAAAARKIYQSDRAQQTYRMIRETKPDFVVANVAICLIHQANYLLDQLIRQLERDFVKHGGIRERMTQARIAYRNNHRYDPPQNATGRQKPANPKNRSNQMNPLDQAKPSDSADQDDSTNPSDRAGSPDKHPRNLRRT